MPLAFEGRPDLREIGEWGKRRPGTIGCRGGPAMRQRPLEHPRRV